MGLFRNAKELFSAPPARPAAAGRRALLAAGRNRVVLGILGGSLVAAIGLGTWLISGDEGPETNYYLFLNAIDPAGRPVAGAQVKRNGKAVGVTDSFGEWRQIQNGHSGEIFSLSLSKRLGRGKLGAERDVKLPNDLARRDRREVAVRIQMLGHGTAEEPAAPLPVKTAFPKVPAPVAGNAAPPAPANVAAPSKPRAAAVAAAVVAKPKPPRAAARSASRRDVLR